MSVSTTVLLILGIGMLIEGSFAILFPKWSLKVAKKVEKHLKIWGIGESIIAITLIILALVL